MDRRKLQLMTLMATAAIMDGNMNRQGFHSEETILPKEPVQPKGTKEYLFNIDGELPNQANIKSVVFKCFALNDKNAIKKFKKWKLAQK